MPEGPPTELRHAAAIVRDSGKIARITNDRDIDEARAADAARERG